MRAMTVVGVAVVLGFVASGVREAQGEVATQEEMRLVCENWLSYMVSQRAGWAGEVEPKIADVQQIIADDGHTVLAQCFSIVPRGYIVVPVLKELPPIKAYSEESDLDVTQTVGMPQLLREVLEDRIGLYIWKYGSLDATQPPTGDVLLGRGNRQAWDDFLAASAQFDAEMKAGALSELRDAGPLLSTAWHQRSPYDNFCPTGDTGCSTCPSGGSPNDPTVVGCVATAMAQVMRYHAWPQYGVGSYSYPWDGDNSCGASGPPYPGAGTVSATLSDTYDWANMPNDCTSGCTTAQQNALAELCYEVGVTLDMDYGVCGSGTSTSYTRDALRDYFRYDPGVNRVWRANYSATQWFDMIKTDLNADRPIIYRIKNHAIVCDGWRVQSSLNQYHMNYGWADSHTAWYTLDNLYCPWTGCGTAEEYMVRDIKPMSAECLLSSQPEREMIEDANQQLQVSTKNRFLSFIAGDVGQRQSIRVKFLNLPVPYNKFDGLSMWVSDPFDVTEIAGSTDTTPPTFKAAGLQCGRPAPRWDWAELGTIHVFSAYIVSDGEYEIRVLDAGCVPQDLIEDDAISPPLILNTSKYGDVCATLPLNDDGQWGPPDGTAGITSDVIAILKKALNKPGLVKARAELGAEIGNPQPDLIISMTRDVVYAVQAYLAQPYPFPPPQPWPCP